MRLLVGMLALHMVHVHACQAVRACMAQDMSESITHSDHRRV
jgi:hypothetical protein